MRLAIFILICIVSIIYGFLAIKTIAKQSWVYYLYFGIVLLVVGNLVYQLMGSSEGRVLTPSKSYAFGFILALMSFNLVVTLILFGEDIFRVISWAFRKLVYSEDTTHFASRRKFISKIALSLAAIPFASLLYGMYKGRYNFRVLNYTLHFEDLPEAFDGYRITQISDIHSGSFDNKEKIEYAVDLINEQKSDVLLFTGDMVNNKASEMIPWKETFGRLKAEDGKFSVLGNHDYGDYVDWNSKEEKLQNLEDLKTIQKDIGFDLLLNESRYLEKESQRLALIGVENWGTGGFKQAGDLKKASSRIEANDFKILMTHDPSHWDAEVVNDAYHYHLTLCGHTHGMQFGIEIPGWIKWSPAKWRYKQWAGIYEALGQYINVNRGFGYLGYPGRVGIWPEITVIELKKGAKTT
jgi:predicted MPP superfamily phosphohydrolase